MNRKRKHINRPDPLNTISGFHKGRQIADERGRFAGDIDEAVGGEIKDLGQGLGMDAIPRGIQDNGIRMHGEGIDLLKYIPGDEVTVVQMIAFGIDPGSLNGFFHDFDPGDRFRTGTGQDLRDGAGPAVQVKNLSTAYIAGKVPDNGVELFSAFGIGLEKREGKDLKGQPQQFLDQRRFSVKDLHRIILHDIGIPVIGRMQDTADMTGAGLPVVTRFTRRLSSWKLRRRTR